jgi:hypothetical protein
MILFNSTPGETILLWRRSVVSHARLNLSGRRGWT